MKVGIIGVGNMGYNLAKNMAGKGHIVVAYDKDTAKISKIDKEISDVKGVPSINVLVKYLDEKPRVVWVMVNAECVDEIIEELICYLKEGDILIDGGNSFYKDSIRRHGLLKNKGIYFLDVGTSGGVEGAAKGACFMVGGEKEAFDIVKPLIKDMSCEGGFCYLGKPGSGHFAKMVHNGIEYGMMQAIAEGLEIIKKSGFGIDLEKLTYLWNNGSVIRSWLIELISRAYKNDTHLSEFSGVVGMSGEGEWVVKTAKELGIMAPVTESAVDMRKKSKSLRLYQGKVVQALRSEFGNHKDPEQGSTKHKKHRK